MKDALEEKDKSAIIEDPVEEGEGSRKHDAGEEDQQDVCMALVDLSDNHEDIELIALETAGRSVPAENPSQMEQLQVKVSCFLIYVGADTKYRHCKNKTLICYLSLSKEFKNASHSTSTISTVKETFDSASDCSESLAKSISFVDMTFRKD